MKTTLNLTYEDGLKVVEAMKDVATEYDWTDEEIAKLDIIEQYTSAVDAALAAMGISVSIASEPEVEDDDESKYSDAAADCYFCNSVDEAVDVFGVPTDYWSTFDEDNNDDEEEEDTTNYSLTPKGEFVLRYLEAGHSFEEAYEVANLLFGRDE
jgi:hypothetical protein